MPCLVCGGDVEVFLDLGMQPVANGFLAQEDFEHELWYPLKWGKCASCDMAQILEMPSRETLFSDQYPYVSSWASRRMVNDYHVLAMNLMRGVPEGGFVVEIGSNDGILLKNFADLEFDHLGVEPCANVAQIAQEHGVETMIAFFDDNVAREIYGAHGPADLIVATNVMCHLSNINAVMAGIKALLKPRGRFVLQDPYLVDAMDAVAYDQIYDEHAMYFTATSLKALAERHGLMLSDVQHKDIHGGSLLVTMTHAGWSADYSVERVLAIERRRRVNTARRMQKFADSVRDSKNALLWHMNEAKDRGQSVAGYGATSKSTTVLNYCGITPDLLPKIYDTMPTKIGKYSPGVHIPIVSYDTWKDDPPDAAVLFAWNHAREIMAKERGYKGAWITYTKGGCV